MSDYDFLHPVPEKEGLDTPPPEIPESETSFDAREILRQMEARKRRERITYTASIIAAAAAVAACVFAALSFFGIAPH